MKKLIKFIAIIFALVLSITTFVACDSGSSGSSKEKISLSEFTLSKAELLKSYMPKEYDLIEDYSMRQFYSFKSLNTEESEIVPEGEQDAILLTIESETVVVEEKTLDVKRVNEDVFITVCFYEETNQYERSFGENANEDENVNISKTYYQTGKNDRGYYLFYTIETIGSTNSYISSSIENYCQYFKDRESYIEFLMLNLITGFGNSSFDVLDYSNYYHSLSKIDGGVEMMVMNANYSASPGYSSIVNSFFKVHYTNDGIYTESNNDLYSDYFTAKSTTQTQLIMNVEYASKYDIVEFDDNKCEESNKNFLGTIFEKYHSL
ncbi:MAG: hypothetical protein E7353_08490 [Clostridiales bacterium]|nr:hypothetical protein [Clostridiales bacterium]